MSAGLALPRRQRGDINTGTAVAITLLVIALLAWWMYWPETIPVFGQRPESELSKRPDPRDPRAGGAVRSDGRAAQATADPNPPLYKWQDANGQWHITDKAPKDRPYEKVVVDPGTNVIPPEIPELPAEGKDKDHKPR